MREIWLLQKSWHGNSWENIMAFRDKNRAEERKRFYENHGLANDEFRIIKLDYDPFVGDVLPKDLYLASGLPSAT